MAAVVNFPPRQIGKFMSEVLTLGFPDETGEVVLIVPDRPVPNGGRLFWVGLDAAPLSIGSLVLAVGNRKSGLSFTTADARLPTAETAYSISPQAMRPPASPAGSVL